MVAPVWLDRQQSPPSIIKKNHKSKKKIPVVRYEADLENIENILPPAPSKSLGIKTD